MTATEGMLALIRKLARAASGGRLARAHRDAFVSAGRTDRWGPDLRAAIADAIGRLDDTAPPPLAALAIAEAYLALPAGRVVVDPGADPGLRALAELLARMTAATVEVAPADAAADAVCVWCAPGATPPTGHRGLVITGPPLAWTRSSAP